jgi:hypothetical protein
VGTESVLDRRGIHAALVGSVRILALLLFAACAAPPCPPPRTAETSEWWPLPGRLHAVDGDLDPPSREFLEEIVRIMQNRPDVRALRVEARTEEEARAVADILAGMGVPRAMIEILGTQTTDRIELSLLLAREG